MKIDWLYLTISLLPAFASLGAVVVAKRAMNRGLTYAMVEATLYTLILLAIGRLWHTTREVLVISEEWAEYLEYGINFLAYGYFIKVGWKSSEIQEDKKNR